MPFQHLAGVTAPAAPDEIVDWFATFEAWIQTAGWVIVAGAGTEDLVISSTGEAAGFTKLFVHIWRDGVNPNRVRGEVRDDAPGTHETTRLGYVDSGGVQFAFWMTADKDAIAIVFKSGQYYRLIYLGCLVPIALNPPDETYYMVATNGLLSAAILRQHTGVWDRDITNYHDNIADNITLSALDGSFPVYGLLANKRDEIAGEYKHIGAEIGVAVPVMPEDTITTGYGAATSSWIVLSHLTKKFALQTSAGLPAGLPDGAGFASQAGITADAIDFITVVLPAFLVPMGWIDLGPPGVDTVSRLFYSQGESGTEDIYCIVGWTAAGYWRLYVQDDAVGTHRTPAWNYGRMTAASFPSNYVVSGDLDCFVFATIYFGTYYPHWLGMVIPSNPNLPSTDYRLCTHSRQSDDQYLLRGHDGLYNKSCDWYFGSPMMGGSQPNLFDGTTYLVWPGHLVYPGASGVESVGMTKYLFCTSGGGIAQLDTITVGPRVYTVYGAYPIRTV